MTVSIAWYLALAALLFALGACALRRSEGRAVELLVHASILALVAGSRLLDDLTGQRLALLVMVIAATWFSVFRQREPPPSSEEDEGSS
ncbi:MAG: NADH-quinone oxidoreductase subunit K [Acidobacteriota bacterium]